MAVQIWPFKLDRAAVKGLTASNDKLECPTYDQVSVTAVTQPQNHGALPKGLIGPKCTATVTIEGVHCDSLLDSGSQVTTISKSFHENYLSHQHILPIQDLLDIEGAGGQEVPYLGYVQVSIQFSEEIMGRVEEVNTLALVVPDHRSNTDIPLLIGTNTLDPLYEKCAPILNKCGEKNIRNHCSPIVRHLCHRFRIHQQNGKVGAVKLQSKKCITVPAGGRVALTGYARNVHVASEGTLLVESPSQSALPGGLLFCSYVMTPPSRSSFKVPVLVKNETTHDIKVPAGHTIADLSLPMCVSKLPKQDTKTETCKSSRPPSDTAACNSMCTLDSSKLTFDFTDSPLPEEWKERITRKLNSVPEVFALSDLDYGHTTKVKHRIRLSDETPFKQRPRPIHPSDYEAVRLHLKGLHDAHIIRESESPFASPIVVVKKKNGDIRLCVDYRKLNRQTIKDAYALPNIEEAFSALTGSKWFSIMDLKSGYYQVEMEEEDKCKTAFVTPMGFWEFNRMPQGVTNAPSTFQRVMEKCMGNMNLSEVLVFLDDLIVFSDTLEEHEERLLKVLHRLRDFGLKLSPEKCQFFRTSVRYLGHIVSANGVETDQAKIASLTTWPRPTNISELKSFLGFAGYYRRFIKDYSKIAKPLNDLTAGFLPPKRRPVSSGSNLKCPSSVDFKKPFNEKWTSTCDDAFKALIQKLTTAPVLGFADPRKPYVVHTDASTQGLGAALYQEQEGKLRVIAYASRGLSRCERRYPAHKLEFLALKWAVTEKFFDYLYGAKFTVVTDNNPLTYVLTSAKLDAAGHRWLAALSSFDFNIQYRAGKKNQDADALSRRPCPNNTDLPDSRSQEEDSRIERFIAQFVQDDKEPDFPTAAVKAICQRHQCAAAPDSDTIQPLSSVECLAIEESAIPAEFCQPNMLSSCTLPQMSLEDWVREQKQDPVINRVITLVKAGNRLSYRAKQREEREVQLMLRVMDQLVLTDEILYRKRISKTETSYQLVLPMRYRTQTLESLHDAVGHMGVDRTLDLVRARFYWPHMAMDVNQKIRTCERCIRRKARAEKCAPLVNIRTSRPLELVCMDYLSLEPDGKGTKNVLVITDHFTKYAVAVPTPDQKSKTVAKALWNNFFIHYGFPERLHSDQGRDFESTLIKELCSLLGIKKTRTTPYHPRGNPVERFNRTLLEMLGTLEEEDKTRWRDFVQPLVHAYNCTRNDTTGFSPYQLMFGRQPKLPIDIAFGLNPGGQSKMSHSEYVKKLAESLKESYRLATEHSLQNALHNKHRFDRKVRESALASGDRVLVRNVGIRGKHKIADRWSETIFTVVKQVKDSPVYVVVPENTNGPEKVLHRDLLLPCGFLPSTIQEVHSQESGPRKRPNDLQHSESPVMDDEEEEIENEGVEYYSYSDLPSNETNVRQIDFRQESTIQEEREIVEAEHETSVMDDSPVQSKSLPNSCKTDLNVSALNPEAPEFEQNGQSNDKARESNDVLQSQAGETVQIDDNLPNATVANPNWMSTPKTVTDVKLKELNEKKLEHVQNDPGVHDEEVQLRRSSRDRMAPKKLTYPTLGNPLVTVMHSILTSLDNALFEALNFDAPPYICQMTPLNSEVV